MRIDKERLEGIIATITPEDAEDCPYSFYEKGKNPSDDEYSFFQGGMMHHYKDDPKDEDSRAHSIQTSTFLERVKDKELVGRIWLGWQANKEKYYSTENWEEFAKEVGISELVAITTKVPKTIARRFEFFANQSSNKSAKLRGLVIDYVREQWKEQADNLVFREEV